MAENLWIEQKHKNKSKQEGPHDEATLTPEIMRRRIILSSSKITEVRRAPIEVQKDLAEHVERSFLTEKETRDISKQINIDA